MSESTPYEDFRLYRSRGYFHSLDGIRALSILAVVWHHAHRASAGSSLAELGFLGVDMFFVLSGFLIVTLLLRERDRQGEISLRSFYLRRSARIFPAYFGLLAALTAFYTFRPDGRSGPAFFRDLPYLLTYTSNWINTASIMAIAWSLAAAEQFYVVWPPIEKWLSRWVWAVLLGIVAVNQVVNFLMVDGRLARWAAPWTLPPMARTTFTPICLGVALAHVLHSPRGFRHFARLFSTPLMPVALLAVLYLDMASAGANIAGWPRLSIQVLMTLLLGSCVIQRRHWLSPAIDHPVLRRIGVVSYGIYLYHLIGMHLARAVGERTGISFPGDLLVTTFVFAWCLAELSYRCYERPFLRLEDALASGRSARGVSCSTAARGPTAAGEVTADRLPLSVEVRGEQPIDQSRPASVPAT